MPFECQMRVYYEDTDAGGRVYYARYLHYAERARTEWLRHLGIEQTALLQTHGMGFVVRHCSVDYLRPAYLDDCLTIRTALDDITRATIRMRQQILKQEALLVQMHVKLALIHLEQGRVARMPEPLFALLSTQVESGVGII